MADDGWRTAHVVPTEWHDVQVPDLCPAGRLWHRVQTAETPGWRNFAAANATPTEWQLVQVGPKWFAGALWHAVHAPEPLGCTNFHDPSTEWHVVHAPLL